MPTPSITFTINGPTYVASEKAPLIAPPGAAVKIAVDPGVRNAVVNFHNFTGKKPIPLASVTKAPYELTVTAPAAGTKVVVGVECRANRAQIVPTQAFTIIGQGAPNLPTKPNTDTDPVPTVPPVKEELPPLAWGIVGNSSDGLANMTVALQKSKADGATYVRLWHSHFGKIDDGTVAIIKAANALGIKVILCVQPKDGKPYNLGTPDFGKFVSLNAAVLKLIEYVEAGNELHCFGSDKYRPDDLGRDWHRPYVDRWLKPLSIELRKIGVKAMLTSTVDAVTVEKYQIHAELLKAAGAIPYIGAVATHLYATEEELGNVAPVLNMLRTVYGKPVVITECAPNKRKANGQAVSGSEFPALAKKYVAEVRRGQPLAALAYRALIHPNAKEWPTYLSLFDKDLKPTPTYAALLAAVKV